MSEQKLINYLLWMKERGQTVLVPNIALSSFPEEASDRMPDVLPEIAAIEIPAAKEILEALHEPSPPIASQAIEERSSYKVLFFSLSPLTSAEEDMVSRIGAALNLETSEFAIAAGEAAQRLFARSNTQAIVLMGEDAYPLIQARIHQTVLVISHPGAMLTEPQLKVTAWNALQKLKATL